MQFKDPRPKFFSKFILYSKRNPCEDLDDEEDD
jgi:hypothetical protein